jgi:hypothetical protein
MQKLILERSRKHLFAHIHVLIESVSTHAMTVFPKATVAPLPNALRLLAHRACATLASISLNSLGFSNTLGQDLGILAL